ncbi:MAG: peptidylprolyl isomerase [Gammaproteobacteria bacterium]|nr:peptidylprolyl isomerase [Gammaproteobacteria bacterium]
MQISQNSVVTLHYTVSTEDGTELDSSTGGEPLSALLGSRFLISGLEEALQGKAAGEKFDVTVAPEKAYGERLDHLVQAVPASMFDGMEVEPGMQFRATTDAGEQSVIVIEKTDDEVIIDGNHPLAGVALSFEVEVLDVREPTEDELAHGHVHGKGGCNH